MVIERQILTAIFIFLLALGFTNGAAAQESLPIWSGEQASASFELVRTFEIVVPEGYIHESRLSFFRARNSKYFFNYHDSISDENFSRTKTRLSPGLRFTARIYLIKSAVSSPECLAYLNSQGAVLVGAQGLSLVFEQRREELPVGHWLISLLESDLLWTDSEGYHRVPRMSSTSNGFLFDLGLFENGWWDGDHLLCFVKE